MTNLLKRRQLKHGKVRSNNFFSVNQAMNKFCDRRKKRKKGEKRKRNKEKQTNTRNVVYIRRNSLKNGSILIFQGVSENYVHFILT